MKHARLSASASHRWLTCPASIKACETYKDTSGSAAEWGTACHGVGELLLKGEVIPDVVEGLAVDAEMLETAEEYVAYCRSLYGGKTDSIKVEMIEQRFDFSHIIPESFGTGDYTVLVGKTLHVVDLKTGHNIVHAEKNSQLMLYGIGAIVELEAIYDIDEVVLHISQGRANHYDSWSITPDKLVEWGEWVRDRAVLAMSDNAPFQPEKKACQWCNHKANCVALKEHVETMVTGKFDNLEDLEGNADKIDLAHIKNILDNADLIKGFVKAVEDVALERIGAGENIDGYKLVQARTNRKWIDEKEVETILGAEDIYVKKLKPMTKLLKEFGKDYALEDLLFKPEGSPVIAPIDDKRDAISSACEGFEKL